MSHWPQSSSQLRASGRAYGELSQAVLRHLHDDRVFNAVRRVEPENSSVKFGRCPKARAARCQRHLSSSARASCAFSRSTLMFSFARCSRLLHTSTSTAPGIFLICSCSVSARFAPLPLRPFLEDLHIDRRGQPEVQRLIGDIRGLEEECLLRETSARSPAAGSSSTLVSDGVWPKAARAHPHLHC